VIRTLAAGIAFTLVACGIAQSAWGPSALLPAAIFGGVATAIQLGARWLYARYAPGPKAVFPKGWLYGMALRMGGVVLFAAAVLARRDVFAPLPTAVGFLGVIVPLLFLELGTTR
jgi:hypothetical protein